MSKLDVIRKGPRGSLAKLADALGITRGAVAKWDRVPADKVLAVEANIGVPRHVLRPDLYPPPDKGAAA